MLSKSKFATLVPIKKMKRALKFYTGTLGGKVLYKGEGEMAEGFASVQIGREEFWLISPSKQEKRKLAYNAFLVRNIKAEVKALQKKGVKFAKAERMGPQTKIDGPISWEPWGGAAFFNDSEGNCLMLWQNIPPM